MAFDLFKAFSVFPTLLAALFPTFEPGLESFATELTTIEADVVVEVTAVVGETMETVAEVVGVEAFCVLTFELSFGMVKLAILLALGFKKDNRSAAVSGVVLGVVADLLLEVDFSRSRLLDLDLDFSFSNSGEEVLLLDERDLLSLSDFEVPEFKIAPDELRLLECPDLLWGTGEFLPLGPWI